MRLLPATLLLSLLATGSSAQNVGASTFISSADALAHAQAIFSKTTSCGFVEESPRNEGEYWAFTARTGYAGERDPNPILVNKQTGIASWASAMPISEAR